MIRSFLSVKSKDNNLVRAVRNYKIICGISGENKKTPRKDFSEIIIPFLLVKKYTELYFLTERNLGLNRHTIQHTFKLKTGFLLMLFE